MANKKITLKRVIDAQGNTDTLQPTTAWDQIEEKPTTFVPTAHTHTVDDIDSETTAAGLAIVSDGAGSAVWQLIEGGGGASVTVSTTAPTSAEEGDLWFDSTDLTLYLYYDDGQSQQWISVSGESVTTIFVDSEPPSNPAVGALWFDSSSLKLFIYYDDGTSTQWISLSGSGASVIVDSVEPSVATEGDLWFDTTTNNLNIYYDKGAGLAWNNVVNGALAGKMDVDGTNSDLTELNWGTNVQMTYNSDKQVLEFATPDLTTLQIGGELWFINGKASGNISNGDLVQFAGVQGDHYLVKTVVPAEVNANKDLFIGLATEDALDGEWIKITWFGEVSDIDTAGWAAGDILYYDSSTGGLTNVEPTTAPIIQVAAVVAEETAPAANNGRLLVRPQFISKYAAEVFMSDGTDLQTEIDSKSGFFISDTAPTSNVSEGDLWFNSTNLTLYIYYDDGDSLQWVNAAGGLVADLIDEVVAGTGLTGGGTDGTVTLNADIADEATAEAGSDNTTLMTPLRTAQYVKKGQADGVASLDSNGKVPSGQLPSYVDDVIEGYYNTGDGLFYEEDTYTTEITGETSKIYISLDTNTSYRWSGSLFVEIAGAIDISNEYAAGVIETNANTNTKFWTGTESEYAGLGTYDNDTLYFTVPDPTPYLSFDGIDDYINLNTQGPDPSNPYTFAIKVNLPSFVDEDLLLGLGVSNIEQEPVLFVESSKIKYRVQVYNGIQRTAESSVLSVNETYWVHGTFDGSTMRLYINGNLEDSTTGDPYSYFGSPELKVFYNPLSGIYTEGKVYNVQLWSKALSETEINDYIATLPTGNEANLVNYYDFSDGTGTTLTDQAGNSDGTIFGATWGEE